MHFITGGAFNGKRNWVKEFYKLSDLNEYLWISAYENNREKLDWTDTNHFCKLTIIEGIEQYFYEWTKNSNWKKKWDELLEKWQIWESLNTAHTLIVIGTDITKGVVPIDKKHREWRDITGWCYQELVNMSNRVDVIWYGINERIK